MPKDLLYKDIPKELQVYDTHNYLNTIWGPLKECQCDFVMNVQMHIYVNKG